MGKLALAAAAAGLSVLAYQKLQERWRRKHLEEHLERWTSRGPAKEPVVECQVPVEHGASGEDLEYDVVEVPVGLAFECERLRHQLREKFLCDDLKLVEELSSYFAKKEERKTKRRKLYCNCHGSTWLPWHSSRIGTIDGLVVMRRWNFPKRSELEMPSTGGGPRRSAGRR